MLSKKLSLMKVSVAACALISSSAFAYNGLCCPPRFCWQNFFIGVEGGASISNHVKFGPDWHDTGNRAWEVSEGSEMSDTELGTHAVGGIKIGYHLNRNVAVDLAYDRHGNFESERTFPITSASAGGKAGVGEEIKIKDIKSDTFLADLILNPTVAWCGFTPYVSGGIGIARNQTGELEDQQLPARLFPATFDVHVAGERVYSFAWQAGVGVDYVVCRPFHVNLGYRYFDIGKIRTSKNLYDSIAGVSGTIQPFVANHVGLNEVYAGVTYSFC